MAREVLTGIDLYAELLSQDLEPAVIRARMGITKSAASGYLTRIRAGLGVPLRD